MATMKDEMQRVAFTNYAVQFGLKSEWLGKTITDDRGRKFTVVGLNINSKRFPVVTKEGVRFAADYFKMLMTGNQKAYKQEREKEQNQQLKESRKDWKSYAEYNGLKKEWLDKTFTERKHTYTIVGIQVGPRSTTVVTTRQDGRVYFWPVQAIVRNMTPSKSA